MTAATITPTAIDAHIRVDYIKVVGRHRTDLGDIAGLAASIGSDVGLLNPITITRDGRLIAGERRLAACRQLGWTAIPARFADNLTEAAQLLRAERDENTCRKDMLPSEKASLGAALEEIEAADAKARQGTRTDLGHELPAPQGGMSAVSHETRQAVGEALGMHGSTYGELSFVHQAATDPTVEAEDRALAQQAMADMDAGRGIKSTAAKLRRDLHRVRVTRTPAPQPSATPPAQVAEPQDDPKADPLWVPHVTDSTARAAEQRRVLIRHFADQGYSSGQISQEIGILEVTVRRTAREHGIRIPADEVLGRSRKTVDSNRILRESVRSIEGVISALDLVNFEALDPAETQDWTASLTDSIRALNRLNKRLKEMVQ